MGPSHASALSDSAVHRRAIAGTSCASSAGSDPTTRRMLESILSVEEEHADELRDWMGK